VFYIFHLWKAFREYHFVLRGPIQNEQKLCFVQAKRLFCYHAREKMEMPVDPRNPMPKRLRRIFSQLCHKHSGSSSEMELVMEALCLHWKVCASVATYRNIKSNTCLRTLKTCAGVATYQTDASVR
jgi:hypothetical protein